MAADSTKQEQQWKMSSCRSLKERTVEAGVEQNLNAGTVMAVED